MPEGNSEKTEENQVNFKENLKNLGNKAFAFGKDLVHSAFNAGPPLADYEAEIKWNREAKESHDYAMKEGPPSFNLTQMPPYGATKFDYLVRPYNYSDIIKKVERCPEAIGILSELIKDIVSDGFRFETVELTSTSGRNKIISAEKFCENNFFKEELKAALMDWLMLGDCALWKGKITLKELEGMFGDKLKLFENKELEFKKVIKDEDDIRSVKHLAWSTVRIRMNTEQTAIDGYMQEISGAKGKFYDKSEIIHGKFMSFDGKAYGFSPMISALSVISSLNLIKDVNGNFFDKGGVPDYIFSLPTEAPNSQNVKRFEHMLREYQQSTQKHGNMIVTGEIKEPIQLNKWDKDMEFRQHAIYLTGVLALAFNMPLNRIAVVIGTEAKSGARSEDVSSEAYQNRISEAQDYWEQLLNTQLFMPHFGVKIKFNRMYKSDEIKETQARLQHLELLNRIYAAGMIKGDHPEYAYNLLRIDPKYRSNKPFIPYGAMGPYGVTPGMTATPGKPGGGPAPGNNPQVMQGPAVNSMINQKKDEQAKNVKPKEYKEIIKLDWNAFKKLKDKLDKRKPMGTSGIVHYTLVNGNYKLNFATPDYKYYTEIMQNALSQIEEQEYILKDGIQVEGRIVDTIRQEVL